MITLICLIGIVWAICQVAKKVDGNGALKNAVKQGFIDAVSRRLKK